MFCVSGYLWATYMWLDHILILIYGSTVIWFHVHCAFLDTIYEIDLSEFVRIAGVDRIVQHKHVNNKLNDYLVKALPPQYCTTTFHTFTVDKKKLLPAKANSNWKEFRNTKNEHSVN